MVIIIGHKNPNRNAKARYNPQRVLGAYPGFNQIRLHDKMFDVMETIVFGRMEFSVV